MNLSENDMFTFAYRIGGMARDLRLPPGRGPDAGITALSLPIKPQLDDDARSARTLCILAMILVNDLWTGYTL